MLEYRQYSADLARGGHPVTPAGLNRQDIAELRLGRVLKTSKIWTTP